MQRVSDRLTWALFGALVVALVLWALAHYGSVDTFDGLVLLLVFAGLAVLVVRHWPRRGQRAEVAKPVAQPVVPRVDPASPEVARGSSDGLAVRAEVAKPVAQPVVPRVDPASPEVARGSSDGLAVRAKSSQNGNGSGNPWPSWDAPRPSASLGDEGSGDEETGKQPGALLARVSPRLMDYSLVREVIEGTRSQNEAIRTLWGSKDGKTQGWLVGVRDFFAYHPDGGRADIIAWELESGDGVVDVAERLGVSVEEVQAVFDA